MRNIKNFVNPCLPFFRELIISQCFFLKPFSWISFFQQHVDPSAVTVFDASHCYWLRAELLNGSIIRMNNLEELRIQDTKVALHHLPRVFEACPKIVKLSFTLLVRNTLDPRNTLDLYYRTHGMEKTSTDNMEKGFRKLTHLKIFTFNLSDKYLSDFWPATFGVLRYTNSFLNQNIIFMY